MLEPANDQMDFDDLVSTAAGSDTFVNQHYNLDCVVGCQKYLPDNSIDLIITDPPFAIKADKFESFYNRKKENVLKGYNEINEKDYFDFSLQWLKQAERILKSNGSIYIVSGYTNLIDILNALKQTNLILINHLIWKYNFGLYTKRKYVSSHFHILFLAKGKNYKFNLECRYRKDERDKNNNLNYKDRESVWEIKREYQANKVKNKNQLPSELIKKMIMYSSDENDIVCDLFLGSFSTSFNAKKLNRKYCGFEINKTSFNYFNQQFKNYV